MQHHSIVEEEKITPEESIVATDGGRYDVNVAKRSRQAIYWEEAPSTVRRCSWFFKGSLETRYTPYDEEMAEKLEEEYRNTLIYRLVAFFLALITQAITLFMQSVAANSGVSFGE